MSVTDASGPTIYVREAARATHPQRRLLERPAKAGGRDALRVAADRQQRDEVAHVALEGQAPPPRTARTAVEPRDRPQLDAGEAPDRPAAGDSPARGRADRRRWRRAGRPRSAPSSIAARSGELRVRRLLVDGMAIDPGAGRRQPLDERGIGAESRSPTSRSGRRPSRSSAAAPPSAAITRSAPSSHGLVTRRQRAGGDDHDPHRSSIDCDPRERRTARQLGRVDRPGARRGGLHRLPSPA